MNNGANVPRSELQDLQSLATEDKLTTLSPQACINVFSAVFNNEFQNILLIVNDASSGSTNSLITTARGGLNASAASNPSTRTTTINSQILVDGARVTSCLAQPTSALHQTCTLNVNGPLFIVALVLNFVMLLFTGATLLLRRFRPLVTLGDAIASFLHDPEPATRRNALLTKFNLRSDLGGWGFTEGKFWAPTRDTRWFRTASLTQWSTFALSFTLTVALVGGAFALSLASQILDPPTISPFGRATPRATFLLTPASNSFTSTCAILSLVASLPQLLLAALYLATNALLTSFFLSHESALYAIPATGIERRGLRVSANPVFAQTTSLFLTLPRPVSWALAGWFVAMGFVLSQGCFVVSLRADAAATSLTMTSPSIMGLGFSGVALAALLGMVGALGLGVAGVALGMSVPSAVMADDRAVGNPLVFEGGSCSAVLSARCHRVPGETEVGWGRVAFGMVPDSELAASGDGAVRHITYTAGVVEVLDGSYRYV